MGTKKNLPKSLAINLAAIAQRINELHGENVSCRDQVALIIGDVGARAITIGRLLLQVKSVLKVKGEFGLWRSSNCPFSEKTAENYMRVTKLEPQTFAGPNVGNKSLTQLYIAAGILPDTERIHSEKNTDPFHDFWHRVEKIPTWIPKLTGAHRERMRETLLGWLKMLEA